MGMFTNNFYGNDYIKKMWAKIKEKELKEKLLENEPKVIKQKINYKKSINKRFEVSFRITNDMTESQIKLIMKNAYDFIQLNPRYNVYLVKNGYKTLLK
jgi:hypothetical protein